MPNQLRLGNRGRCQLQKGSAQAHRRGRLRPDEVTNPSAFCLWRRWDGQPRRPSMERRRQEFRDNSFQSQSLKKSGCVLATRTSGLHFLSVRSQKSEKARISTARFLKLLPAGYRRLRRCQRAHFHCTKPASGVEQVASKLHGFMALRGI